MYITISLAATQCSVSAVRGNYMCNSKEEKTPPSGGYSAGWGLNQKVHVGFFLTVSI